MNRAVHVPTHSPLAGAALSLLVPGLGYTYLGRDRRFVWTLMIEIAVIAVTGWSVVWLAVHLLQAAIICGAIQAANVDLAQLTPPPPAAPRRPQVAARAAAPPPPAAETSDLPATVPEMPPATRASVAPLEPAALLAELRLAWDECADDAGTTEAFEQRKQAALESARVASAADCETALAAIDELVRAGIVTAAERSGLADQLSCQLSADAAADTPSAEAAGG